MWPTPRGERCASDDESDDDDDDADMFSDAHDRMAHCLANVQQRRFYNYEATRNNRASMPARHPCAHAHAAAKRCGRAAQQTTLCVGLSLSASGAVPCGGAQGDRCPCR